jgi:hypothetical protein
VFKDDRFISILSGIVLMIAIGTVVQRGGPLVEYFTGGTQGAALAPDSAETAAGARLRIDVLANDAGIGETEVAHLRIAERPDCGSAFVEDGAITYLPESGCAGTRRLTYAVRRDGGPVAEVRVEVLPAEAPRAPAGEPEAGQTAAAAQEPEAGQTAAAAPAGEQTAPGGEADPLALAEPRRAGIPARPAAPGTAGLRDTAPALARVEDLAAPAATGPGPSALSEDSAASGALAPVRAAAPVAQPGRAATRAPERIELGADEARNNDFAAASSRGGLLMRPGRASTQARPAATVLAQARKPEIAPSRVQPGALGAGGSEPLEPGAGGAPAGDEPAPSLAAGVPLPPARPDPGAGEPEAPPALAASDGAPERLAPEPGGAAPAVAAADPEPLRRAPGPAAPRFGGADGERVSRLSPPPAPETGVPAGAVAPEALQPTATVSLARIDRTPEAFRSPGAPTIGAGPGALDARVPRARMPTIGGQEAARTALVAPESGLGEVRNIGGALTIVPVDTTAAPSDLVAPTAADSELEVAALPRMSFDPDQPAVERAPGAEDAGADDAGADAAGPAEETEVAALPRGDAPCTTPPAMTYDPRPGGMTEVIVIAPCEVGQIVTVAYSGIELALRVDAGGKAQLSVPGFERSTRATLNFPDGKTLDVDLPFQDTERLVRVGLAWDLPVSLDLHAIAAGAAVGSEDHVWRGSPGSYREARRGGGYLASYRSIDGFGDNLQVYTHVIPRGGGPEVVKMMIDFATRHRAPSDETCGTGRFAAPGYRVLRSERGQLERTLNRRLGAIACKDVETVGTRLIERAVEDVIVSSR